MKYRELQTDPANPLPPRYGSLDGYSYRERQALARKRQAAAYPIKLAPLLLLLSLMFGLGLWAGVASGGNSYLSGILGREASVIQTPALAHTLESDPVVAELAALLPETPELAPLVSNPRQYPVSLLELVLRNPETLDFVLNYPQAGSRNGSISISADLQAGGIPLFLQWDERWGYRIYGSDMMAITGCGPTCLSMVVTYLTGDSSYNPYAIAEIAEASGFYVPGSGTAWSLMRSGARLFGLVSEEFSLTEQAIVSRLAAGTPIICAMRPGDFTSSGHFIVLTGLTSEGGILVHDPNSPERSAQVWTYEQLEYQISNLWAFYREL